MLTLNTVSFINSALIDRQSQGRDMHTACTIQIDVIYDEKQSGAICQRTVRSQGLSTVKTRMGNPVVSLSKAP